MNGRRVRVAAVSGLTLAALAVTPAGAAASPGLAAPPTCASGAHTLSHFGDHVYPETGNGGYTSLHTDVHIIYDAPSNQFLPGNHVVLSARATQCLTDFSLDFERTSVDPVNGPDMTVNSILVNGRSAAYKFVQPTYPGDPNGQDDPNPLAHAASQVNPVGGPHKNPLPPACTPEVTGGVNAQNGDQCPANKLVITPSSTSRPAPASPSRCSTPAVPVCTPMATARPRAGSETTHRRATVASSPPSRSAPRTGCRSMTIQARSRPTTSSTRSTRAGPRSPTACCCPQCTTRRTRSSPADRQRGTGSRPPRSRATWSRTASERSTSPLATRATGSATTRPRAVRSTPRRSRPTSRSWTSSRTSPTSRLGSTGRSRSRLTASSSASPRLASRRRCKP